MYAQCPDCLTFFRVRPEQLKAAQGHVRCSQCKHVFNALETLRGDLTADELRAVSEARRAANAAAEAPLLREESNGDLFAQLDYTDNAELPLEQPAATPPDVTQPLDEAGEYQELPSTHFHQPRRRRGPLATLALLLVNAVLLLALAAQWVHFHRDRYLQHPEYGLLLQQAYADLGVPIELPRDLAAISVSQTNVSSHPDHDSTLQLTAVIENRAPLPQPFPELRIDLQDRWGETVGARYFRPSEYLRDPAGADRLMAAGTPFPIELPIRDPGATAVGYNVEACIRNGRRPVCSSDLRQVSPQPTR